ncbi:MAG TPA: NAD(P)-binding domain-containing protein [Spirochaetia bacterium]|nr:NAD(P)-binding domain-containing protein [Spirochaetia bacterium]
MKIAVLGTGTVGTTIASKLVSLGHEVMMGSRDAANAKGAAWATKVGGTARHGTFSQAATFGEIVFNCTAGTGALQALEAAGAENLGDKVLIDVSNPLDFSKGMPPALLFPGNDSLGERIQQAFPRSRVVKTLNTITASLMVEPGRVSGEHDVFVSGNDAQAKAFVSRILREWLGWKRVVDLGDIKTSRGAEAYVLFWVHLWGSLGTADFNISVRR